MTTCNRRVRLLFFALAMVGSETLRAETREGQHTVFLAPSFDYSFSRIELLRGLDYNNDGVSDKLLMELPRSGMLGNTLGYRYQVTPNIALGADIVLTVTGTKGPTTALAPTYSQGNDPTKFLSGSTALLLNNGADLEASILLAQFVPTFSYNFWADRSINPYLTAGLGLNYFRMRLRDTYFITVRSPNGNTDISGSHDVVRSSLGVSARIGAGIQAEFARYWLVGAESRLSAASINNEVFGRSIFASWSTAAWIGIRWAGLL